MTDEHRCLETVGDEEAVAGVESGAGDRTEPLPAETTAAADAPPLHPDAARMLEVCGGRLRWISRIPVYGRAIRVFGPKFVFALDMSEFLNKGIAYYTLQNSYQPMFVKRFQCSPMQYQRYSSVALMGWSMKPFTALLTDSFAVLGYTKRWVLVASSVVAAAFCLGYGLLPARQSSAAAAAVFTFLAGYFQANLDILSEGLYSRQIRRFPLAGPSLVSSLWVVLNVGSIAAAFIQGPLSDANKEQVGAYICGISILCCTPIFVINWMAEKRNREERTADYLKVQQEEQAAAGRRASDEISVDRLVDSVAHNLDAKRDGEGEGGDVSPPTTFLNDDLVEMMPADAELAVAGDAEAVAAMDPASLLKFLDIRPLCGGAVEFNRRTITSQYRIAVYAACMTVGVLALAVASTIGNRYGILAVAASVSIFLGCFSFWALPPVIARASLFAFLNSMMYVQINGPINSFYVAPKYNEDGSACVLDGPHFSYFFYNTISSVIGNAAGVCGVVAFNYIFAKRTYRLTFVVTVLAEVMGSIFDLIIVKRWNEAIGIPDHAMYLWGDAVVYNVAYMLAWMPMVVLMSQLCPRGSESMVYALLAGFSNLGQSVSQQIGTLLMDFVWPIPSCDYHNLPWLIICCHLVVPLLQIPLVFLLIPAARVCDEIDADGKVIGKKGHTEKTAGALPSPTSGDSEVPSEDAPPVEVVPSDAFATFSLHDIYGASGSRSRSRVFGREGMRSRHQLSTATLTTI